MDQLVSSLTALAEQEFNGSLAVSASNPSREGVIYLVKGRVSAVHIHGFMPNILRRLVAAGIISDRAAQTIAAKFNNNERAPEIGEECRKRGLIDSGTLSAVNREYLLSALNYITTWENVKVKQRNGDNTTLFTVTPNVPVEKVLVAVSKRSDRWDSLLVLIQPSTIETFRPCPTVEHWVASSSPVELRIMAPYVNGERTVDEIAGACGLTRFETLHLLAPACEKGEVVDASLVKVRPIVPQPRPVTVMPPPPPMGRPIEGPPPAVAPTPAEFTPVVVVAVAPTVLPVGFPKPPLTPGSASPTPATVPVEPEPEERPETDSTEEFTKPAGTGFVIPELEMELDLSGAIDGLTFDSGEPFEVDSFVGFSDEPLPEVTENPTEEELTAEPGVAETAGLDDETNDVSDDEVEMVENDSLNADDEAYFEWVAAAVANTAGEEPVTEPVTEERDTVTELATFAEVVDVTLPDEIHSYTLDELETYVYESEQKWISSLRALTHAERSLLKARELALAAAEADVNELTTLETREREALTRYTELETEIAALDDELRTIQTEKVQWVNFTEEAAAKQEEADALTVELQEQVDSAKDAALALQEKYLEVRELAHRRTMEQHVAGVWDEMQQSTDW